MTSSLPVRSRLTIHIHPPLTNTAGGGGGGFGASSSSSSHATLFASLNGGGGMLGSSLALTPPGAISEEGREDASSSFDETGAWRACLGWMD